MRLRRTFPNFPKVHDERHRAIDGGQKIYITNPFAVLLNDRFWRKADIGASDLP